MEDKDIKLKDYLVVYNYHDDYSIAGDHIHAVLLSAANKNAVNAWIRRHCSTDRRYSWYKRYDVYNVCQFNKEKHTNTYLTNAYGNYQLSDKRGTNCKYL